MEIKRFNRILIVTVLILGLSLSPVFAVADNSELENSLKSGWTSSNNGTYGAWSNSPSGYSNSWYYQFGKMLSDLLRPVRFALTGSDSASWSNSSNTIFSKITGIYTLLSQDQTTTGSFKYYQYQQNQILSDIRSYLGSSTLNSTLSKLDSLVSHAGSIRDDLGYDRHQSNSLYGQLQQLVDGQEDLEQITTNTGIIASNSSSLVSNFSDRFISRSSFSSKFLKNYNVSVPQSGRNTSLQTIYSSSMPYIGYRYDTHGAYANYSLTTSSIFDYIIGINSNLVQLFNSVYSPDTIYRNYLASYDGSDPSNYYSYSLHDTLYNLNYESVKFFSRLGYVLADDDTIQRKKDNAAVSAAALDNFTGSGSAAASVSDIGAVKDSVGSLKDATSGGASFSQAFNAFSGDSDGWSWFSQENADAMDTTGSESRLLRSGSGSSTPFLDAYYSDIFSILGGGDVND